MLKASFEKHTLRFKQPSGTSRGILHTKNSWIVTLYDDENPHVKGLGEASIIESLSPEWNIHYETALTAFCQDADMHVRDQLNGMINYPSIRFAFESALMDLKNGGKQIYYPSDFTLGKAFIPINGLIWMGSKDFMLGQIEAKIDQGYTCLKLKIGAIDFETELEILRNIRTRFSQKDLEIRVDANGAFSASEALGKLLQLAAYDLHSIEQPIAAGQWEAMKKICEETPLPIALDEELIGINKSIQKSDMIRYISPQYIILKPSLIGGFESSDEWISCAEKNQVGWWITSALESNIGLNAIAQYTFTKNNPMPQGLGTGQLYENNFESDLKIENGRLFLRPHLNRS